MKPEEKDLLSHLLNVQRVAALSVDVDDAPYVGLLPFVVNDARDALLVHASNLARHSNGLGDDRVFAALLHLPDSPDMDPLQIPRLTVSGSSSRLARGTDEYESAKAAYLAKFPGSAMTFSLGDFHLYRLAIAKARFVIGFGRALNVRTDTLAEV